MYAKDIVTVVEDYYNLEPRTCYKKKRSREISRYRNIVAYMLTQKHWTIKQIATFFNMERTSFYRSIEQVEDEINTNRIYRHQIAEIKDIVFSDGVEHSVNQETKAILNYKWEPNLIRVIKQDTL
jgi:chromosomal replication initiation ATPase DnaA